MKNIFSVEIDKSDLAVVTIDVAGDSINTWTDDAFVQFAQVTKELGSAGRIRGIIFISGKPNNFLAGANLNLISQMEHAEQVLRILDLLHGSFSKLSSLDVPAIAAIHGFCLGGGLEFALACTGRIAQEGKNTLIGLPECKVGLLPGGGGTQRLPRLIGYKALELILNGTILPAKKAYELGIIDRIVPAGGDLLESAKIFLKEIITGRADLRRPLQDFSDIDSVIVNMKSGIVKADHGREIPAKMLTLKSMHEGLKASLADGLEVEKKYFVEVALTKEAKGSINKFFLERMTDKPAVMITDHFRPQSLKGLAILGFQVLGREIAIDILRNSGLSVVVKDLPEHLETGKAYVRTYLERIAERNKLREPVDKLMTRLIAVSEYSDLFSGMDIVINTTEENGTKESFWNQLCQVINDDCVIATASMRPINSNTSFVDRPERYGGIHLFSPKCQSTLMEVIRWELTADITVNKILSFAGIIRKRPIVCRDNPGHIVNALVISYLNRALQFVEEGYDIDVVEKAAIIFGMASGPFKIMNEIGVDLENYFRENGFVPRTLMLEEGNSGLNRSDEVILPNENKTTIEKIKKGLLESMVKTGNKLLEKRIVDDVRMIDIGMIWGAGFPAEKGGPMKWSDLTGMSRELFKKKFYS